MFMYIFIGMCIDMCVCVSPEAFVLHLANVMKRSMIFFKQYLQYVGKAWVSHH